MANFSRQLPPRRTIVKVITISVLVVCLLVLVLGAYVYRQAVGRFEVRRVSLPTRVYTDMQPLRPGLPLTQDHLREKLERLGYRESSALSKPGDFRNETDGVTLNLREFRHPSGKFDQTTVRLVFDPNGLAAVTSSATRQPVEDAALEPELLTSILSDQLENRRPVTLDQVPRHLVDAVVVTEDVRFWSHPGVDPMGILRALFRNVRKRGVTEGGSTLTQQLVKNYYLTNERTMRRKVVEAFMSLILDAKYSKREILEAYLNDIYLGRNRSIQILGVGEAARFYFGKPVSEISIGEAAVLAGMVRSPNNNSPFANPERATERRKTVLNLLLRNRKITREQHDAALQEKLPTKPYRERSGLASIPYYVDRVLEEARRDYGIEDVKGRGLAIYTAIDLDWQNEAAQAVESSLRNLEKSSSRLRRAEVPLQGALVAVDLPTGEIRALVGGRNYEQSQFNRVTNAKRQVGSLFKPFVYLTAFEPSLSRQNITPATLIFDNRDFKLARKYSKDWSPRNYEDVYYGVVTVRRALEQSMNVASVRLGLAVGLENVIKTATALGIETEMPNFPSLILGAVEIPPIEMVHAYSSMGRMGNRVPLRTIRFITNDRGSDLSGGETVEGVQVFPARDVYLLVRLMQGVVERGTAASAKNLGFRKTAAGKTGTTNDKRDAWFIGFTPRTLALTWIGFDDNQPVGVSGSEGAVPMWARFMRDVVAGEESQDFPVPAGIVFTPVDTLSGGIAMELCPKNMIVNEAFKEGTQPVATCTVHIPKFEPLVDPYAGLPPMTDTGAPLEPLGGGTFRTNTAPPAPQYEPRVISPPPQPALPPPVPPQTTEPAPAQPPPRTDTVTSTTSTQ